MLKKMIKIDKYDKILAVYLAVLFIFLFATFQFKSVISDEGTHLLLSAFYKDLITNIIQTKDFSFSHIYNYGINYFVHYPKLQIAYPPLYHLTTALIFTINQTEFSARTVNLVYAILSFFVFYLLAKKFFSAKTALLATFLSSFSFYSLYFASYALQDFAAIFFFLLSTYFFSVALTEKKTKYFVFAGFSAFLSAFSKQIGGLIIIFFLLISLWKKQRWQNILVMLLAFSLPLIPYLLVLQKAGALDINKIVAIETGIAQGEPASPLSPAFWLWYLIKPVADIPFMPLILLFLLLYIYNKKPYWKEMLIFFLVIYLSLSAITNKELRFSQLFLLPAYIATAFYLQKIKIKKINLVPIFLTAYAAVSLLFFIPTIQYYPVKDIAQQIYASLPEGANIAMLSEDEPLYSSALMWHLRQLDDNISLRVLRQCAFFGNRTEMLSALQENNVYFIVYSTWSENKQINKIRDMLDLAFSIEKNGLTTEVYKYKNYSFKPQQTTCNYACLTMQKVCVS